MAKNFKYVQAAETICQEICTDLSIGDSLPKTDVLCHILKVSEITIKKALALLVEKEIVRRVPGHGTFLNQNILPRNNLSLLHEPKTVIVAGIERWPFVDAVQRLAAEYCEKNPGVKIEFKREFEWNYKDLVKTGDCNLVLASTLEMREFMTDPDTEPMFLPLEKLPGLNYDEDRCFKVILKWCKNRRGTLALPLNVSPVMSFVNRFYPGADLERFEKPMNFAEFRSLLEYHKSEHEDDNHFPFYLIYTRNRWCNIARAMGGELFSRDGKKCLYNTPEVIQSLEYMQEMMFKSKLCMGYSEDIQRGGVLATYDLFKYDSLLCSWGTYGMMNNPNAERIRVVHLPEDKQRFTPLLSANLMVTKNTENIAEIVDFINFLMLPNNRMFLARNSEEFPARKDIAELLFEEHKEKVHGAFRFIEALEYASPLFESPRYRVIAEAHNDIFPVWINLARPAEACEKAASAADNRLKKLRFV